VSGDRRLCLPQKIAKYQRDSEENNIYVVCMRKLCPLRPSTIRIVLQRGAYLEKRIRVRARKEKQQEKQQRKVERKRQAEIKPAKDSDLEGIRPGPQPGQILNFD
jgi:hypothetical protein